MAFCIGQFGIHNRHYEAFAEEEMVMFEFRSLLRGFVLNRYAIHRKSNYTDCLIEASVDMMVAYSKTEEFRNNIDRGKPTAEAFLYDAAFELGPDFVESA